MANVREKLKEDIILLDGATGTNLQKAGMPSGCCPELWILEHPRVLLDLQQAYVKAGSEILYAPTFSGNAIKLREYGLADRQKELNQKLVSLTRQAAGADCFVAGNLTMTGQALAPVGTLDFEELVGCYREQAEAIAEAGVDLFVIETMMSIQECRAAVLAVKETTDLPVFVTITLEPGGCTLYGTDPVTALITMEALGVDAFGINCSCGPDTLLPIMQDLAEYTRIPLIAKPNAGLPRLEDGKTLFDMPKEAFARHMKELAEAGVSFVGGCCGTDASYIQALKEELCSGKRMFASGLDKRASAEAKRPAGTERGTSVAEEALSAAEYAPSEFHAPAKAADASKNPGPKRRILTGERGRLEFTLDGPFHIVGERINPTGKKKLQEELLKGSLELVAEMAREQEKNGASLLDVNVGLGGIDEKAMMLQVISQVCQTVDLPLCIDSGSPQVVEAALRRYPGRALVNSVTCEKEKMEKLLPIVKKYGAMFILLPLTEEGIPANQEERWQNIRHVLKHAYDLGFEKEDIVVDGLVAAAAAEPKAALDTLDTIARCRKNGLATICGLSNISFGLPDRSYVNSVFLAMAMERGLTMAIANPAQELFVRSSLAADLLLGKEQGALRYVEYSGSKEGAGQPGNLQPDGKGSPEESRSRTADALLLTEQIRQDILKGKAGQGKLHVSQALDAGQDAFYLLNQVLIPAIGEVGELFNQQKFFLPQLIVSAKAMEAAVAELEPALKEQRQGKNGPTVVIATVKGDIHDIGKNLVAMMMRNYGFRVIDLGKDVGKERILAAAREYQADVIGLSALMTTTMSYMKEVIGAVREQKLPVKVIVGGAAVTQGYAEEIGADGYSKDAVEAVELVRRLTEQKP